MKLIYLRQYLSYSADQKLKMSEMLMAIVRWWVGEGGGGMVYSTSGITSGKKCLSQAQNGGHFENFEILNIASIWPQIRKDRKLKMAAILKYQTELQSNLRYEKIVPNHTKKVFYGDDVIDDVTGWPQSFSLYSCLGEVGSGSNVQGQCLLSKCHQYHNCLSRSYMPKNDLNE